MTMRIALAVVAAALTLSACGATTDTGTNGALAQAETSAAAPAAKPAAPAAEPEPAAPKASSCDVAREAILTGTKADIAKALTALQNDKSADADAREYARYYLGRDKDNAQMQEMDISIIQMSCSL